MKDNIPMEGVVELFSSSNIFVDEEGLVSLNDVYRIAIERGLDGGPREGDRNADDGLVFRNGRWHRDNGQKIDGIENARIENSMVSISLSPESARDTRIARKIAAAPNLADKARLQGYYDFMLGKDNAAKKQSKISEVSYLQGWKRGQDQRERLNGLPWYETEKSRDGEKWSWSIYREGLHQKSGEARSEKNADLDIEVAKADLMDAHDDWSKKGKPVPCERCDNVMGHKQRPDIPPKRNNVQRLRAHQSRLQRIAI